MTVAQGGPFEDQARRTARRRPGPAGITLVPDPWTEARLEELVPATQLPASSRWLMGVAAVVFTISSMTVTAVAVAGSGVRLADAASWPTPWGSMIVHEVDGEAVAAVVRLDDGEIRLARTPDGGWTARFDPNEP